MLFLVVDRVDHIEHPSLLARMWVKGPLALGDQIIENDMR
jgi:hypothetical protein